jgi:hypothetical protein
MEKRMGLENMNGGMEHVMKANGKIMRSLVMDIISGLMEESM